VLVESEKKNEESLAFCPLGKFSARDSVVDSYSSQRLKRMLLACELWHCTPVVSSECLQDRCIFFDVLRGNCHTRLSVAYRANGLL